MFDHQMVESMVQNSRWLGNGATVNGIFLWRSPIGRLYLIDRTGATHAIRWHTER